MQEKYMIDDVEIYQPDEGLQASFETTYSSDSGRVQSGVMHATPLFTVEQFGYVATDIPVKDATIIIQKIVKGLPFKLHYFSPYYGMWRDDMFRVGKGQYSIGNLEEGAERYQSLSFNMTGENPL